jgi:hypothetical protein
MAAISSRSQLKRNVQQQQQRYMLGNTWQQLTAASTARKSACPFAAAAARSPRLHLVNSRSLLGANSTGSR